MQISDVIIENFGGVSMKIDDLLVIEEAEVMSEFNEKLRTLGYSFID